MAINSPSRMHSTLVLCLKRFYHPLQDRVIIWTHVSHTPSRFGPILSQDRRLLYRPSKWSSVTERADDIHWEREQSFLSNKYSHRCFLRWNLPLWRGLPDSILDRGSNIQMTDCLRLGTSKSLRRPQSCVFTKLPLHELHAPSFQSPLSLASGFGPPLALYEWSIHAYELSFSLSEWPYAHILLFGSYGLNVLTHRIFDQNWSNFVDTSEIWHF